MLKPTLMLALVGAISLPLLAAPADADAATCKTRKVNGTLLGAAGGALLGHAIGGNTTGTVVGGLGGAVAGREIGRSGCNKRTYYRSASVRPAHRAAPARYEAPRVSRKVYYDQYGNPIRSVDYSR